MAGRKQHFLAATYLAGFSPEPTTPRRESPIWVGRREVPDPYTQRCDAVAYKKDLYGRPAAAEGYDENLALVDETWNFVEQNIGLGIDALITSCRSPLPARLWASVLVPFAAQVFVRGADWIPRFGSRFGWMEGQNQELLDHAQSADNANMARLMELQRLNAAMLAARWQVLHCPADVDLIVNDLGRVPMIHLEGTQGYTIPLCRHAALVLLRAEHGSRVLWDETAGTWFVDGIEHRDLTEEDVKGLNAALRDSALAECFGPAPELVRLRAGDPVRDPAEDPLLEPFLLAPSPEWLRSRELDWARMLTIVSAPPQRPEDDQPWTVWAEVTPEENETRAQLQRQLTGVDAEWTPAPLKRDGLLERMAKKLRRSG